MYTTHMNFEGENFYSLFGISKDASDNEIRKAYLKLIRKIHPDKQTGANQEEAHEKAAQLNNAYEVLKDAKKRTAYDAYILRQQAYGKNTASSSSAQNGPRTRSSTKSAREKEESHRNSRKPHANQDSHSKKQSSTRTSSDGSEKKHYSSERPHSNSTNSNFYTNGDANSTRQGKDSCGTKHSASGSYANSRYGNSVPPPRQSSYSSQHHSNTRSDSGQYSQPRNSGNSSNFYTNGDANSANHGRYSSSSKHSTSGSYANSRYGNSVPPPRQSSYSSQYHSNTRSDSGQFSQPRNSGSSSRTSGSSSRSKIYGVCKNGLPCKRCMKQGGFCYQHANQKYSSGRQSGNFNPNYNYNSNSTSSESYKKQNIGICKSTGQPCKRCLKQGTFCFQHLCQAQGRSGSSRSNHSHAYSGKVYGVTLNGTPCKRCLKQGGYCYQHTNQQKTR